MVLQEPLVPGGGGDFEVRHHPGVAKGGVRAAWRYNGCMVTTGAQLLLMDLEDGCSIHRNGGGAPCVVMPRPGGRLPRTKGQIADSFVGELLRTGLISKSHELTQKGMAICARLAETRRFSN